MRHRALARSLAFPLIAGQRGDTEMQMTLVKVMYSSEATGCSQPLPPLPGRNTPGSMPNTTSAAKCHAALASARRMFSSGRKKSTTGMLCTLIYKIHLMRQYFHCFHWEQDQIWCWGKASTEIWQGLPNPGSDLFTPIEQNDLAPLSSVLHLQSFMLKHHN